MLSSRRASQWCPQVVAVVLIGALTTGCHTTTAIPAMEAVRLDHRVPPPHVVTDSAGERQEIGESFAVTVAPRGDLPPAWAYWAANAEPLHTPVAIEVRGPVMYLQGATEPRVVQIPLAYIQEVRVREFSPGKTAGLTVGVVLGAAATLLVVGVVALSNRFVE